MTLWAESVRQRQEKRGETRVPRLEKNTVTVGNCTVSLLRGGNGAPLLYLHGAGGAGVELPFMTALANDYDLIVPEHPGFGQTDEPDWLDDIQDVAYFYLDFLDQLDLTGVHLVGMSLGGWIAMEIAVRNATRLATLTLAGASGVHVPGLETGDLFTWSPEETLRQAFHDPKIAEAAIAKLPANIEADDTFLKNRSTLARLGWEPRMHNPHLPKWLHRITVPTRVVWGDDDRFFSAEHAPALAALIPGASVTVIPACGHLIHLEQPDAFVTAINEHIGGVPS